MANTTAYKYTRRACNRKHDRKHDRSHHLDYKCAC